MCLNTQRGKAFPWLRFCQRPNLIGQAAGEARVFSGNIRGFLKATDQNEPVAADYFICKVFIAVWSAMPRYAVLASEALGLLQQIGEARAQLALEELAARVLRQTVDEDHFLRHFEVGHVLAAKRQHLPLA